MNQMIKSVVFSLLLTVAVGCSSKSSGGSSGIQPTPAGGGNTTTAAPQSAGVCQVKTAAGENQALICSEFSSQGNALTTEQVQKVCIEANQEFTNQCPAGQPVVVCRVASNGVDIALKVYGEANTRDYWVKECQNQGGKPE